VTYFLLNAEDYRWAWTSFLASASTAVYVFAYATYYFFFKTKMHLPLPIAAVLLRALLQIGRNGHGGSSHRPEPLQVWLFADHVLFWPNGCYVCSACNRLWKRWVPGCAGIRSPHLLWGKERLAGCIVPPVIGKSRVSERAEEGPVH